MKIEFLGHSFPSLHSGELTISKAFTLCFPQTTCSFVREDCLIRKLDFRAARYKSLVVLSSCATCIIPQEVSIRDWCPCFRPCKVVMNKSNHAVLPAQGVLAFSMFGRDSMSGREQWVSWRMKIPDNERFRASCLTQSFDVQLRNVHRSTLFSSNYQASHLLSDFGIKPCLL